MHCCYPQSKNRSEFNRQRLLSLTWHLAHHATIPDTFYALAYARPSLANKMQRLEQQLRFQVLTTHCIVQNRRVAGLLSTLTS
jgi:hypothetical protein